MRIGIDATSLPPRPVGAGTYMIQLIRALADLRSGDDFVIFAQQHGADLIGLTSDEHLEWVLLPDRHPALRLAWEQVGLPRLLKNARVELLHSLHYTRPVLLPCASVVTFHDMTFFLFPQLHTRAKRLFFPLAIRFSARQADALIADSESTRQDAIRLLNIPPQKITAISLAAGEAFQPILDQQLLEAIRQRYNLPARFVLYVGLVEPRKNVPMLIRSYAKYAHQSQSPVPLVIAGRFGWMSSQVLAEVEQHSLQDLIYFTGYIPAQDLPIVYNLADVFVYPSTYEGFGLPPLEAMACGTPVITTSVSSMPEHVGEAGILIAPQDESALSAALQSLLSNAALRQELSQKGRRQAEKFTWKRTAQETLNVYRQVLNQS